MSNTDDYGSGNAEGGNAYMTRPVDRSALEDDLEVMHSQAPQLLAKIKMALQQIYEGIAGMATMGYSFALHEVHPDAPGGPQFPMMVFASDGTERIVANAPELEEAKSEGFLETHPDAPAPPVAAVATNEGEANGTQAS